MHLHFIFNFVANSDLNVSQLTESGFRDVALANGFSEEQETVLSEFYMSSKDRLDAALNLLSPSVAHYHDLEWRFDVQVLAVLFHFCHVILVN